MGLAAAPAGSAATTLRRAGDVWIGEFRSMASPCEVLMEVGDRWDAQRILSIVASEARRVEAKFSRYLRGNVVHRINNGCGLPVAVDEETARLLTYSAKLHEMSGGKFDITSGVLRKAWTFDGGDALPSPEAIREALGHVGWDRVEWDGSRIRLREGMEIDLGGIAKEYAVDRAAALAAADHPMSCLVNFGGDLAVTRPRAGAESWRVGIESPGAAIPIAARLVRLTSGALATSGSTRRFVMKDGVRYGHILDPTTGRPVPSAPLSVTVAAGTCVQAGTLSTLAMLEGGEAESFLQAQECKHWIFR